MRVVFLSLILLLAGCFGPTAPEEDLAAAKAAVGKGDNDQAVIFYKNALLKNPSLLEASYDLGALYITQGDLLEAGRFLEDARVSGFSADLVFPLLAAVYFQQNKMPELAELIKEKQDSANSESLDLQLALYDVLLLSRSNKIEEGLSKFEVLGEPAQNCELCLFTLATLQSYSSPSSALATLNELLLNYPNNAQAYLLRGQLYFALQNPRQALENFIQFQVLQPKAGYVQFLLAVTAMQMKEYAKAGDYVDRLLSSNPQQPLVNHLKALLAFEQEDYSSAWRYAEKSIDRGLKSPVNYLMAGVGAYKEQKIEIAYKHLLKAADYYPGNAQIQKMLMSIQLKFGNFEEARQTYLQQDVRNIQDVLLGNSFTYQLIQQGLLPEADSVLSYLENTPVTQPAIRLQMQALRSQIDPAKDSALAKLEDQSTDKKPVARLVNIMLLLESKDLAQAEQAAQVWLAEAPDNVDALNISAYVFQQSAQPEQANTLYERALLIDPRNIPSLFFQAQQAILQSDNEQANAFYQQILQINPQNLAALQGILGSTFSTQQSPIWERILGGLALPELSDDQVVALADAMFQWQSYAQLDMLLSRVKPRAQWSDTVWMIWLKNSFFVRGATHFQADFAVFFQRNTLKDHVLFALSILEKQGQVQLQLQLLNDLPEQLKGTTELQLVKAIALLELQQNQEADDILRMLDKQENIPFAIWYAKGRLMENRGDLNLEANYLQIYYNNTPDFSSVTQLATVLNKANRTDDLLTLAQSYVSNYPYDYSSRLALAMKLVPEHPTIALDMLQGDHIDWLVHRSWRLSNNMAWLYLQQDLPNKALVFSSNAIALNPQDEQVNATHKRVLDALSF